MSYSDGSLCNAEEAGCRSSVNRYPPEKSKVTPAMSGMNPTDSVPSLKLYNDLAEWFPLLTPPEDYAQEAVIYRQIIERHRGPGPAETVLELGCGGGHNACHLKARFRMTLADLSPAMLDVSRKRNPECEHLQGDMRTLRLDRQFHAVFIQDAIGYMTSEADLSAALTTAFVHCVPGGVALFCPDFMRETFTPGTTCGGSDGDGRALRYLEWTWDPDPDDHRYRVDFAYLLRTGEQVQVAGDTHVLGLFSRGEWERLIRQAGFDVQLEPFEHRDVPPESAIFVGRKPRT